MALLTDSSSNKDRKEREKKKKKEKVKQPSSSSSSWGQIKNLLSCKQVEGSRVHDPSKNNTNYSKLGSSCSSICSFKDVVHGNTRVVHRADNSPESSTVGQDLHPRKPGSTLRSNNASSSRAMQFRKLSGCYECHTIVDPSRYPYSPRTRIRCCTQCGEVFPNTESLEHHQAVRHAVLELGPEDSGRNIVEIIFKSSWLKKESPMFKIERILKVHNSARTVQRFEECREAAKYSGSSRKSPRCAADGNELLRFHCTTLSCALGARGSSSLCSSVPACSVCTVIRTGFHGGQLTTNASSGRAHDSLACPDAAAARAMLVCRVIAGRVRRNAADAPPDDAAAYHSVAANLDELTVYNAKAILPCFVVIYKPLLFNNNIIN